MDARYIAIDLKSFYASVECVDRGLDPLKAMLVVADASRTEKTICLAVSPALKALGISGRARLFEVVERVKMVNAGRSKEKEEISFIAATPRMARYMEVSTQIYNIYLNYFAPEDIHVYSVDEVFIDISSYYSIYNLSAKELTEKLIGEVLEQTGITATAGIGTNLYLCKVAMDIVAKHMEPDKNGARIAELDEMSYRRLLWSHKPLTDFWRVGKGYAKKLEQNGMYTMGDVARCSIGDDRSFYNEELLYKLFGVNAELLIDHAWGYEPCTIADIKSYVPESTSLSQGQVLSSPYSFELARIVILEMTDALSMELCEKGYMSDQLVLTVGYDIENLTDPDRRKNYKGQITKDHYGRLVPKHAHGTKNLIKYTSSTKLLMEAAGELYDEIVDKNLLVRRMSIAACKLKTDKQVEEEGSFYQMSLFDEDEKDREETELKDKAIQQATMSIRKKYGKNALIRGMNLQEGATAISRNAQIGGHKA